VFEKARDLLNLNGVPLVTFNDTPGRTNTEVAEALLKAAEVA
jgi:hypothetical protein